MKKRENVTVEIILTIGSYLKETVFCEKGRKKETGEREGKEGERDEKRKFVKVTIMCLN